MTPTQAHGTYITTTMVTVIDTPPDRIKAVPDSNIHISMNELPPDTHYNEDGNQDENVAAFPLDFISIMTDAETKKRMAKVEAAKASGPKNRKP